MKTELFIGIDIGTQGTKGVLCQKDGTVISNAFCKSNLIYGDNGAVYENPDDIFNSVVSVISTLAKASENEGEIKALCMDAQMAGIMAVDENFEATTPLDSWLDSRCAKYTEIIKNSMGDQLVEKSGGQIIHSHASKILWWKNERPDIYRKIKKFVQPNGYVAGKLCSLTSDDAFMDYTFLHFNVFSDNKNLKYNEKALKNFSIDPQVLPKIVAPTDIIGTVCDRWAKECHLGGDVKVLAGCGDTAASSLGAGITKKGMAYDVAGTASVFAYCTDKFSPDVKNKTLLFSRSVCEDLYLPLAYISGGGLCLKWFSDLTKIPLHELDSQLTKTSPSKTPVFIPHFSGRTFPLDNRVSGAFLELDHSCDCLSMYKAIMESIAYEYDSYFSILKSLGCTAENIKVTGVGGGAKSNVFCQIKADVLGVEYSTFEKVDSAPVACALLAAYATGYVDKELSEIFSKDTQKRKIYVPNDSAHNEYVPKSKKYLSLLDSYAEYMSK